ncbi:hypothetical protein MKX78_10680 [Cytobacillus sp. FSL R5-0569]
MAVSMRERPTVKGKDAERFLNLVKRNEELMKLRKQRRENGRRQQLQSTR